MKSTLWRRLFRGVRKVNARADWPRFAGADWPETIMSVTVTDDFHAKQGRSTGRWLIHKEGEQLSVYLKRHYRLPLWRGILASLFPGKAWSPAAQEEQHFLWAKRQDIPVPEVVASIEHIGPWCRLQSMLATEELVNMLPLHQAIPSALASLSPAQFEHWKAALIAEMARLSKILHLRNFFHKDLYLCHFYLSRTDCVAIPKDGVSPEHFRGRLYMIDFHRLTRHGWTWPIWLVKDLAQLLFSADVAGITSRDRVRFWRTYRDGTKRTRWTRWLESVIRWKWRRYRRHNLKQDKKTARELYKEAA